MQYPYHIIYDPSIIQHYSTASFLRGIGDKVPISKTCGGHPDGLLPALGSIDRERRGTFRGDVGSVLERNLSNADQYHSQSCKYSALGNS